MMSHDGRGLPLLGVLWTIVLTVYTALASLACAALPPLDKDSAVTLWFPPIRGLSCSRDTTQPWTTYGMPEMSDATTTVSDFDNEEPESAGLERVYQEDEGSGFWVKEVSSKCNCPHCPWPAHWYTVACGYDETRVREAR